MEELEVLPIRVRVTAILRRALLSGEFAPGSELSLTETAARLGVSRTPVREAFQALAAEGLLELRMNRGAVVIGIDEKFIRDHFSLRALLESEAVRLACRNGLELPPLMALQERAEASADSMSEAEYRSYNQHLHEAIWRAAGNRKLYDLLLSLWNGPSTGGSGRDRNHETLSMAEHRRILIALSEGREEEAASVMCGHITRSMENILANFRAHAARQGE